LFKNTISKKAKGILYGDFSNQKANGIRATFSAGALAFISCTAHFYVNAAITDIATTHNYEDEMPYMANLVLVNPNDFFIQLVSAKDLNVVCLYIKCFFFNCKHWRRYYY
jgi:hypothetical protein